MANLNQIPQKLSQMPFFQDTTGSAHIQNLKQEIFDNRINYP